MVNKKYTERNPRCELREWEFRDGVYIGKVYFDQREEFFDGMITSFIPGIISEYNDHFMVTWKRDVVRLNKKDKRNGPMG